MTGDSRTATHSTEGQSFAKNKKSEAVSGEAGGSGEIRDRADDPAVTTETLSGTGLSFSRTSHNSKAMLGIAACQRRGGLSETQRSPQVVVRND